MTPMLRMGSGIGACCPTSEEGGSISEMFSVPGQRAYRTCPVMRELVTFLRLSVRHDLNAKNQKAPRQEKFQPKEMCFFLTAFIELIRRVQRKSRATLALKRSQAMLH